MDTDIDTPQKSRIAAPLAVRVGVVGVLMVFAVLGGIMLAAGPLERVDLTDPAGLFRGTVGGWLDRTTGTTTFTAPLPEIEAPPGSATPLIPWEGPKPRRIYPRVRLAEGEPIPPSVRSFAFEGTRYEVSVEVPARVYWGSKSARHGVNVLSGESSAEWHSAEYGYEVFDPAQRPVLDALVGQFRGLRTREGWDSDTYLEFIAKYVQMLDYDQPKADSLAAGDGMRFPAETIADGQGVCSDTCVLLAALLAYEDYDVAIFTFGPENHTAVGVRVADGGYRGTGYAYLETTAPGYVGSVPHSLVGGITLRSMPEVARIGTGRLRYGSAADAQRIESALKGAPEAGKRLVRWAESRPLWPSQIDRVNRHIEQTNEAQRRLQYIAEDSTAAAQYLDRNQALEWIAANAWWESGDLPDDL